MRLQPARRLRCGYTPASCTPTVNVCLAWLSDKSWSVLLHSAERLPVIDVNVCVPKLSQPESVDS
jgi:hypothetical protein